MKVSIVVLFISYLSCSYGVMLEKFQQKDLALTGRIKGCIVDSAPVAEADPQVILFVSFFLFLLFLF